MKKYTSDRYFLDQAFDCCCRVNIYIAWDNDGGGDYDDDDDDGDDDDKDGQVRIDGNCKLQEIPLRRCINWIDAIWSRW